MRVVVNHKEGWIEAASVRVPVDPNGRVLPPLCRALVEAGHDLEGVKLEVFDQRGAPKYTHANAHFILNPPPPKPKDAPAKPAPYLFD